MKQKAIMGQAKIKGDEESRVAIGIAKEIFLAKGSNESISFTKLFPGSVRATEVDAWLARVSLVSDQQGWGTLIADPFVHLLAYIWLTAYQGACHSTSAALFVALSEIGATPRLCVGEVKAKHAYFDHSWVELDGLILDAAVSLPLPGGLDVGGPVFASMSLGTLAETSLIYGASSGQGFDEAALPAVNKSLADYGRMQNRPTFWSLASGLLQSIGLVTPVAELKLKYGGVRRIVVKALG